MPKVVELTKIKYDLTRNFTSANGHAYTAGNLILWTRADESKQFDDQGTGAHLIEADLAMLRPNSGPLVNSGLNNLRSTVELSKPHPVKIEDAADLSFGDGSSDTSFSMSLWIKLDALSGDNNLISKVDVGNIEYQIFSTGASTLKARLFSNNNFAKNLEITGASAPLVVDQWMHIVLTYNASASTIGDRGTFYLNGTALSTSGAVFSSYTAMTNTSASIRVGSVTLVGADAQNQTPSFYEFAIWSGRVLSATDVAALYDVKNGVKTGFLSQEQHKRSGMISLLPRNVLSIRDSKTGSYPTTARTGDSRTGVYNAKFDDRKTLVFGNSSNVTFGAAALSGSYYQNDLVASPSSGPTLKGSGKIVAGISDTNIQFTKGEDLKPFVEENLHVISLPSYSDPFYITGSAPADVGLGFKSSLRSKTKIEIDISQQVETRIGMLVNSGANKIFPMGYYNFSNSRWEGIGRGRDFFTSGSATNPSRTYTRQDFLSEAMFGFAPSIYQGTSITRGEDPATGQIKYTGGAGAAISNFGFPYHPKFHATSSQVFHMTGVLNQPFLCEKIVFETSCSFDFGQSSFASNVAVLSFFLLNQRDGFSLNSPALQRTYAQLTPPFGFNQNIQFGTLTASIPQDIALTAGANTTRVDTIRDIVTFFQASITGGPVVQTAPPATRDRISKELNINAAASGFAPPKYPDTNNISFLPNKLIISGAVKVPGITAGAMPGLGVGQDNGTDSNPSVYREKYNMTLRYSQGVSGSRGLDFGEGAGRQGLGMLTGRGLGGELSGLRQFLSSTIKGNKEFFVESDVIFGGVNNLQWRLPDPAKVGIVSPYLLLPSDKLVLGCQIPMTAKFSDYAKDRSPIGSSLTFTPGTHKLTLYGSFVKDNKEFHYGLNQPLTSDAIHEDIQDTTSPMGESNCLDQYETSYKSQFSGSYVGNVITGSMITNANGKDGSVDAAGFRGIHYFRSGSLLRATQLIDGNERYYDTVLPTLEDTYRLGGGLVYGKDGSPNQNFFFLGPQLDKSNGFVFQSNDRWLRSFPFEPFYSRLNRQPQGSLTSISDRKVSDNAVFERKSNNISVSFTSKGASLGLQVFRKPAPSIPAMNQSLAYKYWYGVGSGVAALTGSVHGIAGSNSWIGATYLRGWKYGVYNALPENSKSIYRFNSYGQFRDRLEQRKDSKFYFEGRAGLLPGRFQEPTSVTDGPVTVKFSMIENDGRTLSRIKVQPNQTTQCSNMSLECTSSMPYFDGHARNRLHYPVTEKQNTLDIASLLDGT
tara:strand:- start:7258 stop:11055 length:3798 start_codon:yes stop_codon:yes gene_type:complete